MQDMNSIPRRSRSEDRGQINVTLPREIVEIYFMGKGNGWDTSKIIKDAIIQALNEVRVILEKPAGKPK
jgi:hypothetical protein